MSSPPIVKVGRGIDEVEERQRRRKLDSLKESCHQTLAFTDSYNAELISVSIKTKTTNEAITIQYGEPPLITISQSPDDIQRVLYLLDRYGVSNQFYHELAVIMPSLPRSYKVKKTRGSLSSEVELKRLRLPTPYNGCYRSLSATITKILLKEVN